MHMYLRFCIYVVLAYSGSRQSGLHLMSSEIAAHGPANRQVHFTAWGRRVTYSEVVLLSSAGVRVHVVPSLAGGGCGQSAPVRDDAAVPGAAALQVCILVHEGKKFCMQRCLLNNTLLVETVS